MTEMNLNFPGNDPENVKIDVTGQSGPKKPSFGERMSKLIQMGMTEEQAAQQVMRDDMGIQHEVDMAKAKEELEAADDAIEPMTFTPEQLKKATFKDIIELCESWSRVHNEPLRVESYKDFLDPSRAILVTGIPQRIFDGYLRREAQKRLALRPTAPPVMKKHWSELVQGKAPYGFQVIKG